MADFALVPYDHERHAAFVFSTFWETLREQWPWEFMRIHDVVDDLKRILAGPDARALVAVAPDDPDVFMGWAVTRPRWNEVVFAYTKRPLRRMGIGSALVTEGRIVSVWPGARVGVRYWTRAAERISRSPRWRLYMRVTEDDVTDDEIESTVSVQEG